MAEAARSLLLSRSLTRLGSALVSVILTLASLSLASGLAVAQETPKPLPPLPEAPLRPEKGPGSVGEFVQDLTQNDASFQVFVGQGRILTTKVDLAEAGKAAPLLAVGDPSVAQVVVLNVRQLRIIGVRTGVTDLSITTHDNKVYSFEIRVVADLTPLQIKLRQSFPEATLKLSWLRDHLVVEGEAPTEDVANKILETIEAFLYSVEVGQSGLGGMTAPAKAPGNGAPPKGQAKAEPGKEPAPAIAVAEQGRPTPKGDIPAPRIINLIRIPPAEIELEKRIHGLFPGATVSLSRVGSRVLVRGQARDQVQVKQILDFLAAAYTPREEEGEKKGKREKTVAERLGNLPPGVGVNVHIPGTETPAVAPGVPALPGAAPGVPALLGAALGMTALPVSSEIKIINLLRVPGPQQVLLKVRVAELNRTGLREIGADLGVVVGKDGTILGTQVGGAAVSALGTLTRAGIAGTATLGTSQNSTAFGIFGNDFEIVLRALRRNSLLKILAEPNLVALNGHKASFLAGGEFPVPIPQAVTGGAGTTVTVQFKKFGVTLDFKPDILDNGVVRLAVRPEVSSLDFAIGTVLVPGGTPVPGLNSRSAETTVELKEGQTLAIAGLLQVTLDGQTNRIPGLGDLPILGAFFSNTTSNRIEKELLVLVTPFLVEPANACQLQPTPGDQVGAPNDLEFFLYQQIESHDGRDWRSPLCRYTAPPPVDVLLRWHQQFINGPHGFTE